MIAAPAPAVLTPRAMTINVLRKLRLNRIAARVYYAHVHGFASASRELPEVVRQCLERAVDFGTAGKGDYHEYGIFKGHTFLQAQLHARQLGLNGMRFFGFDSFEGLPEVTGIDRVKNNQFYTGQYACSRELVERNLAAHGADWGRTHLIEGYFKESCTPALRHHHRLERVPVALIDCDLYSSTVDVLGFLRPMLMDKSILIMDDWNAYDADNDRGQRRAMREFLRAHRRWEPEPWFAYGPHGQVFVMHNAAAEASCADAA